jgi:hypothetical protein
MKGGQIKGVPNKKVVSLHTLINAWIISVQNFKGASTCTYPRVPGRYWVEFSILPHLRRRSSSGSLSIPRGYG